MAKDGKIDDHTFVIKTKNSQFGFIRAKNSIQQEDESLLESAVQMLAVFLERRNIEKRFQKEKESLENLAEKSLSELRNTIQDLRSARNASLNLIEDLTEEVRKEQGQKKA